MSRYPIGLSSGTTPELTASELVRTLRDLSADTVDLRAGKGQRWEEEGLQPFYDARIQVAFVGISAVLGDERVDEVMLRNMVQPYAGLPLKVFAKSGCMEQERVACTTRQVAVLAELAGGAERVLVETHHGYSDVDELIGLHEATGVRILLDTMGLARITDDPLRDAKRLAEMVSAVQVKGFDWQAPDQSRHLPLAATDLERTRSILQSVALRRLPVTVETRAGSYAEDLQTLRTMLAE